VFVSIRGVDKVGHGRCVAIAGGAREQVDVLWKPLRRCGCCWRRGNASSGRDEEGVRVCVRGARWGGVRQGSKSKLHNRCLQYARWRAARYQR